MQTTLNRQPILSADLSLPKDLHNQVNTYVTPMWIVDHNPDRSSQHKGMRTSAGIRSLETERMQPPDQLIPRDRRRAGHQPSGLDWCFYLLALDSRDRQIESQANSNPVLESHSQVLTALLMSLSDRPDAFQFWHFAVIRLFVINYLIDCFG